MSICEIITVYCPTYNVYSKVTLDKETYMRYGLPCFMNDNFQYVRKHQRASSTVIHTRAGQAGHCHLHTYINIISTFRLIFWRTSISIRKNVVIFSKIWLITRPMGLPEERDRRPIDWKCPTVTPPYLSCWMPISS